MAPHIKAILERCCHDNTTSSEAIEEIKQAAISTAAFEAAARDLLFDFCDGEQNSIHLITALLETILESVAHGVCGSDLPLAILEEAMDTQTILHCDQLFTFLEKHRQTMTARMGRGQTLLRLCNDLLRRLSKTEDTVFCGRILIFLSLVFPLSERSAVNLRGEYNLDNVTIYEQLGESMDAETQNSGAVLASTSDQDSADVTDAFYTTFWSLQRYFNNPVQLTTAPLMLSQFREAASTVIEALRDIVAAQPKREQTRKGTKHEADRFTKDVDAVVRGHFTPKVLTSRKLLKLELADLSFRRQILLQFLIVFDYMLSFTHANRETWVAPMPNRSMLSNYILPIAESEWITISRNMVADILKMGRTGEEFYAIVENVLRRDQAWLRWKCSGCQPYDLPPIDKSRLVAAPAKVTSMTAARKAYQYTMGNAVLSKLWKSTNGQDSHENLATSGILPEPSSYLPTVRSLQKQISETQDEDEIHVLEDRKASNTWRALRVARTVDIRKFTEPVASGDFEAFFKESSSPELKAEIVEDSKIAVAELPETFPAPGENPTGSIKRPASDSEEAVEGKRPRLST